MSIKIGEIVRLTNEKFLNLFRVFYTQEGQEFAWDFASRNKEPKCNGRVISNAVVVVAFVGEHTELTHRKLLVTKEFRPPLGGNMWGFVAGLSEGTGLFAEVERELWEESNLELGRVLTISPVLISSGGMSDEAVTMVFVTAHGEVSDKNQERQEKIEPMLLDYEQVCALCDGREPYVGAMISAKAWPVFFAIKERGFI